MNKGQRTTYGIANKGVSGLPSLVSRLHACVGGYERSPQSLTSHTAGTLVASVAQKTKKKIQRHRSMSSQDSIK
jgi:hypothetical protein